MERQHESLVADQFGPQAQAYVQSAVHAEGEDLAELGAIVSAMPEAQALDLGCGGGHVAYRMAQHVGTVVAYDLSDDMLAAVAATAGQRGLTNVSTRQGSAERLPFADASFDVVASRYSAHHWLDVEAGLREARRVLRPGGMAVFMDAVSPGPAALDTFLQAFELLRDPSHVRDYSIAEWTAALGRAGFSVQKITPRRLHLDFRSWVERIKTPDLQVQAIRALQAAVSAEVRGHFAVEPDGSFMLDTASFVAV